MLFLVACAAPPAHTPAAEEGFAWDYEVRVGKDFSLEGVATFRGADGALHVDEDAQAFVTDLAIEVDGKWRATDRADPRACARACRVRWRMKLRELARARADVDVALEAGGAIFSPASTWLVRPTIVPEGARYRIRSNASFVTGTYEAPASSLEEAPFAAFGPLRTHGVLEVQIAVAPSLALSDRDITDWVGKEQHVIGRYLKRLVHGMIFVAPGTQNVTRGKTVGTSILIRLGTTITTENLLEDWVLAHELLHAALPGAPPEHSWFNEGLATYVEPIVRARAGLVAKEKTWKELAEGLARGKPKGGAEATLIGSRDFDRIYWGGALFFFVADALVREETNNARSLDDCLRAVAATDANGEATWPIEKFLNECDRATGTTHFRQLYEELAVKGGTIDPAPLLRDTALRDAILR
jgi:hypothetical protein